MTPTQSICSDGLPLRIPTFTCEADQAKTSLMFAPFYMLYALIVAIAIVVWIVIRRLQ